MQEYLTEQNDYAIKNGKVIYILDAPRYSTGYTCPGCQENMRPVRAHIEGRKSYFRHEPKDIDSTRKCAYSNPSYRRILAMDILARIKGIKVPNLYKYSPDGKSKRLLIESYFIQANSVRADLFFYEDENGNLQFDKNKQLEKDILYEPDITFFNDLGLPILLIKFVENYKTSEEEKAKLRQLGIDTIKIIIPKDSEESIANSFYTSTISKWIYNGTEQQTDYLHLSATGTELISTIDELESRIFEETYACRSIQINNLIRQINKCLGSESYRRAEQLFEQEISRIEEITRQHQSRLDEIRAGVENAIHSELGQRRDEFEERRDDFQRYRTELGNRYHKKRVALDNEQEHTEREIAIRQRIGSTEKGIRNEFERLEIDFRNEFEYSEREYSYQTSDLESKEGSLRREEERVLGAIGEESAFENNYERFEKELREEFNRLEKSEHHNFEREREKLQSKALGFDEVRAEFENRIRNEFERRYQQTVERISNRNVLTGDELSERIANVLQVRGHLDGYQRDIERIEEAKRIIQDGTYKKWN